MEDKKISLGDITQQKRIYTVSELTREIKSLLEISYTGIWVEGEVSNFSRHSSGHAYFTLKDENAQLQAVIFRSSSRGLKFKIENGLHIICRGKVSVYEKRGQHQIYVEQVEPKGLGALQLAFEQLKEKLKKEGLFDSYRKRPIPSYPSKIGVITSPTGAAIRDILNIVNRRFLGTHILIHPVNVQGEGAKDDIANAIDEMNRFKDIDVLIVGRGGGSLEDLWAFNEEVVARAIHRSRIPVISAVGHEIDFTISDMVADLRAPTPSAAAELVVKRRDELEIGIKSLKDRIQNLALSYLNDLKEMLNDLTESYAFKQPLNYINQISQKLDELLRQMTNYAKNIVSMKGVEYKTVLGKLETLSPLGILSRGYSLTFDVKNNLVKSIKQLKTGDEVCTRLHEGNFRSKILELER